MNEAYDIYTGLLKMFPLPAGENKDVHFSYPHHPKLDELKHSYPIENIAGGGDDFSKAVNLLHWVSAHNYHKGDYMGNIPANALDLLAHSYDKGAGNGINCVCLSIILTECLLAIGLKARTVFIMPCSPYDGDNHVVSHVYIREMKKWVMLDPTINAYITNEQGQPLSLFELRSHLADQMPVSFNKEAKYNDDEWTEETAKNQVVYFAKNLFYFQTTDVSTFGDTRDAEGRYITLCPDGYDPKAMRISNCEYRIRKYGGDNPRMQAWLEQEKKNKIIFCLTGNYE